METLKQTGKLALLPPGHYAPLLKYPAARLRGIRYVALPAGRRSKAALGLLVAGLLTLPGYGQQPTASVGAAGRTPEAAVVRRATGPETARPAKAPAVADGDWPSQNRTLTSERYSPLSQITAANVASLKNVGTAELGEAGSFQSGIVVVNNTLFVTTVQNTFAFNPATCQPK